VKLTKFILSNLWVQTKYDSSFPTYPLPSPPALVRGLSSTRSQFISSPPYRAGERLLAVLLAKIEANIILPVLYVVNFFAKMRATASANITHRSSSTAASFSSCCCGG
jgi:hypothetical protein